MEARKMAKKYIIEINIYNDVPAFDTTPTGVAKLSMSKKEIKEISPDKLKALTEEALKDYKKCKKIMMD
jgi:hypothetical protein